MSSHNEEAAAPSAEAPPPDSNLQPPPSNLQPPPSNLQPPTSKPSPWQRLIARLHHLRGMAHRTVGNWQGDRREHEAAVACFTRALQRDPAFVQARLDRAALLWRELDDGAAAERDLTHVLELAPDRAEAWFQRAFARQTSGDLAGAVADFERYLEEGDDRLWRQISREQVELLRALTGDGVVL